MITQPWCLQQSPPAAPGSWRTLFIIEHFVSNPQVVFNSDDLCWTSRGLCWPLRPRPKQALMACTLHLSIDATWHRPWSWALSPRYGGALSFLSDPQEWEARVTQSSSKGNGSNSVKVHLRFCISFHVNLPQKKNKLKKQGGKRKGKPASQERKHLRGPGKPPKGILCGSKGFPSFPPLLYGWPVHPWLVTLLLQGWEGG